jgi:hypothetical protein
MDIAIMNSFLVRTLVVLVAAIAPFIYMQYHTDEISISEFWGTHLEPLFIFTNAATSYFFFSTEKWKPSAILLLLLTAFSVEKFPLPHNIFAAAFFLYSFMPLVTDKRLSIYAAVYISSLVFISWPNIFLAETIGILTLCAFHLHTLILKWVAVKKRHSLHIKNNK